jgi:hypothetical protein
MKFNSFLTEAPIRIDLSILRSRLQTVFSKHPRNKMGLIDSLNKEFTPDDVDFTVSHERPDVIEAYTFPETLEISVEIGVELMSLSNKELINRLIEAMEHEFVHREQLIRSSGKAHTVSLEKIDADNVDQYLADKSEIMAYAIQTVTTLRNEGYKDSQIIDMLRNQEKWMNKITKSRSHLEIYLNIFKLNSYQVKRLKKQIVQYLQGETNE